ncbi:MAG: alpha/beta hydrolase [Anaerolineae bacterium]
MPLHPDAIAFLELREQMGVRPANELTVAEARAQGIRTCPVAGPDDAVGHVHDRTVPGPAGDIPARIYGPPGVGAGHPPLPVIVYYHGGGWVIGNLDTDDVRCRQLCRSANAVVVSVNYRHAPEDRFPAAAEDAYAAVKWVAENAAQMGEDPQRIAVCGASAGGNLAAVVSLMAKDRGGPAIAYQALIVPVTNDSFDTVSYQECAEGYGLTRDAMKLYWGYYLASPDDGAHPYASPLRAADLSGLPPALVVTSEYDPLRDEGEAYAARLRDAGVPVTAMRLDGMLHGFLGADAIPAIGREIGRALAAGNL